MEKLKQHREEDKGLSKLPVKNFHGFQWLLSKDTYTRLNCTQTFKPSTTEEGSAKYAAHQCIIIFFSTRNYWYKYINVCEHLEQGLAWSALCKNYVKCL